MLEGAEPTAAVGIRQHIRVQRKRWDGATCEACVPLSYCSVSNSTKAPDVASADNRTKWIRPFVRQIFFRKECARLDSRARSSEGTAQYRLKLSQPKARPS